MIPRRSPILPGALALCAAFLSSIPAAPGAERSIAIPSGGEQKLTGPQLVPELDPKPVKVPYVEPKPLGLPSQLDLETITVKGKTFNITRISGEADKFQYHRWLATVGKEKSADKPPEGFDPLGSFAAYEKENEALAFYGSGRGGLESKERLIVEDCVFIVDFQEGDFDKFNPKRAAIYVDGYNEVIVRNCVFISKGTPRDPLRKTISSIYAADCQKVQVEDCYFEGRTVGWRGHVNVWSCGPTSIRNCEINGLGQSAGGIWVATGLGEGKIGYAHQNGDPELVIYPPGPVLIENCWVHDQTGKENSDGIYIQSARPYLLRNSKVERWGEDSLFDMGFRDTSKRWGEQWLANHGGIGVIEHCEFAEGWMKDSVGLGGGMVFRHNLMRDAFFFFYAFDGGSFYCVGNRFEPMEKTLFSGRNNGTKGWTPGEGMIAKGGRGYFYNNYIKPGHKTEAIYVAGKKPAPVKEVIVSDYNVYDGPAPETWAIEFDGSELSLAQWRDETGNDKHTLVEPGASLEKFAEIDPKMVELPGGLEMKFGPVEAGLTGPVGVAHPATAQKAKEMSERIAQELREQFFVLDASTLPVQSQTLAGETVTPTVGRDRSPHLALKGTQGQSIVLGVKIPKAGRFYVNTQFRSGGSSGKLQLLVDDKPVGEPFDVPAKDESFTPDALELSAGDHLFTYKAASPEVSANLNKLVFQDAAVIDRERAMEAEATARKEAAAAEKARLDALTMKFPIPDLPISGPVKGHTSKSRARGRDYLLWQTEGAGDTIAFGVDILKAGQYQLTGITTNQVDKGNLVLIIDGKEIGKAALGGKMPYGTIQVTEGQHVFGFKQESPERGVAARLQEFQLLPVAAKDDPNAGDDSGESDEQ